MYLNGEKVRLRNIELSDAEFVKSIENAPETWEFSSTLAPYSSYSIEEYIKSEYLGIIENKQQRFLVERLSDGVSLGLIDLFNYDAYNATAEIGLFIKKECRNNNYGREALELLADYATNHLGIMVLLVLISVDNEACRHLFSSNGFEEIGILKGWKRWRKERKDVVVMELCAY